MPLIVTFLMGIVNFALHRAVQDSGHPILHAMPRMGAPTGRRALLVMEFAVLLAALLLVQLVNPGWAIFYALYSVVNGIAAWLILSHRI